MLFVYYLTNLKLTSHGADLTSDKMPMHCGSPFLALAAVLLTAPSAKIHWPAIEEAIVEYIPLFSLKLFGCPCSAPELRASEQFTEAVGEESKNTVFTGQVKSNLPACLKPAYLDESL